MPATKEQADTTLPEAPPPKARPARPARKADPRNRPKQPPPWAVLLHNDPINGFDFVIRTLQKVFGYGTAKATLLTLRAHLSGRSLVWAGPKEHAEFKAERLQGEGPDPRMVHRGAQRLRVSIEPMPQ